MPKVKIESGSVFERYENKYLLDPRQYQRLPELLGEHMEQDQYGLHTICTLYYDTDDYAIIRRCLEKPKFRQKLRLRSYGVPAPNSVVYLELKKKMNGITYKRRVPLPLSEAQDYFLNGGVPADEEGQIFREIDWYVKQMPLKAKVLICYDRVALFGLDDPDLRVTIDANVRWREDHLALDKGDQGRPLFRPAAYLMEIKTLHALPVWLVQGLSKEKIYPVPFSKYGTIYQEYLEAKGEIQYAV